MVDQCLLALSFSLLNNDLFEYLKGQHVGIEAMQLCMISQPVKLLTKHNFTKYTIKMADHGQHPTIIYEI